MADNRNTQISTAEMAWKAQSVADLETFLQTKVAKQVKQKDGTTKEEMVLPSAPNLGANIPAEWQYKMLHHPLAQEHLADDGKTPAYKDELARMSRYAAWLVVAEVDGTHKVSKDVLEGFRAWYKSYEDQVSAGLSAAREGAKVAQATAKVAVKKANSMLDSAKTLLSQGVITQEAYDAIVAASEVTADE